MKSSLTAALLLLTLGPFQLHAQADGQRLIEAAQRGDTDLVKELLAKGADVNVKTRYGATALFFAVDKANVELVRLLIEKGADVNIVDTFYGATPVTWVLFSAEESEPHREILAILLAEKPDDAAAALPLAAEQGDLKLAKLVVASEKADTQALLGAIDTATDSGHSELATYLEHQLPEGSEKQQAEGETILNRKAAVAEAVVEPIHTPQVPSDLPEAERSEARPWPSFRGANSEGTGDGQGAVAEWDGPSGKNILWKTQIPGLANSSPIIWGDKVFVTSASTIEGDESLRIGLYGDVDSIEDTTEHIWAVYALDKTTGEVLWRRVAATGVPKVKRHLKSTHANPTPATDGRHVVANFGSEGVYCYDFDGRLLWKKDLGRLESGWFYDPTYEWGFSSSPILHNGHVILQIDIQKGSYITALDVTTGREIWKTERDEIPTWGTPVILAAGTDGAAEIVTNGTTVRGYDSASGELLWWLAPNSEITVASPVVGNDQAFVTGGYSPARPVYAVRPGHRGDISLPDGESSSDAIAWSLAKGGVYMPTPLLYQEILYLFHGNGRLAAHDPTTGESIYKVRVGSGNSFSASPVAADGRLFFTSEQGDTFVVRAGRDFQLLGRNTVDEVVMGTPAISDGVMAIRAKSHVYGIGAASPGE